MRATQLTLGSKFACLVKDKVRQGALNTKRTRDVRLLSDERSFKEVLNKSTWIHDGDNGEI